MAKKKSNSSSPADLAAVGPAGLAQAAQARPAHAAAPPALVAADDASGGADDQPDANQPGGSTGSDSTHLRALTEGPTSLDIPPLGPDDAASDLILVRLPTTMPVERLHGITVPRLDRRSAGDGAETSAAAVLDGWEWHCERGGLDAVQVLSGAADGGGGLAARRVAAVYTLRRVLRHAACDDEDEEEPIEGAAAAAQAVDNASRGGAAAAATAAPGDMSLLRELPLKRRSHKRRRESEAPVVAPHDVSGAAATDEASRKKLKKLKKKEKRKRKRSTSPDMAV
jgi:hypothetical protein